MPIATTNAALCNVDVNVDVGVIKIDIDAARPVPRGAEQPQASRQASNAKVVSPLASHRGP
jgi:hypothetical protein